jgi:hypothetical protein
MGSMSSVPRELDWVKERAACTVAQIFSQLHQGVEDDVKSANLARQLLPAVAFAIIVSADGGSFTVKRSDAIRPFVKWSLEDDHIRVSDDYGQTTAQLRITFSNEGRCKLTEHGEELEQWQVRRSALEGLFFAS